MKKELEEQLTYFLNEDLEQAILSNSCDKEAISKAKVRPLLVRQSLIFQVEEFRGKQAFHRNLEKNEAVDYLCGLLEGTIRQ